MSLVAKTLILGGDTRDEEEAKEEHDDGTPDVNCNAGLTVDVKRMGRLYMDGYGNFSPFQ